MTRVEVSRSGMIMFGVALAFALAFELSGSHAIALSLITFAVGQMAPSPLRQNPDTRPPSPQDRR